jgi:hypothetical protein
VPTETAAPQHYMGKWIVVTGVRDLPPRQTAHRLVQAKMAAVVAGGCAGIIFGGARGVDTVALVAAHDARGGDARRWQNGVGVAPKLVVIVPGTVAQQPIGAKAAIARCADETIELGLDVQRAASYHTRNGKMITEGRLRDPAESPIVCAFPTGDATGGTRNTMKVAAQWGLTVEETIVPVTPGGVD